MKSTRIEVYGTPRPGGSKTSGYSKKTGKRFIRNANPNTAPWMKLVRDAAKMQNKRQLLIGPIQIHYDFRFPRPKYHFGTGKNNTVLKAKMPDAHTIMPDLTKIIRSTEDALTGLIWKDDSQVCHANAVKRYCLAAEQPGVTITIAEL